jgi:hypothetical protein
MWAPTLFNASYACFADYGSPSPAFADFGADYIFPVLKVPYRTFGNSRPAGKKLRGKLFRLCPALVQIFRVKHSFALAESFVGRVQGSRIGSNLVDVSAYQALPKKMV